MLETIVTAVISSAITISLLAYFGRTWLEARLRGSIEHEYKKQFELFSRALDRKEKVELVAELMSEYMKTPHGELLSRDQRILLTTLSFKANLWLPPELAIELAKRLQNRPDAKTPFEVLLLARKHLIGDESISTDDITWWRPDQELRPPPVVTRL
jgi:hypothetical protein